MEILLKDENQSNFINKVWLIEAKRIKIDPLLDTSEQRGV